MVGATYVYMMQCNIRPIQDQTTLVWRGITQCIIYKNREVSLNISVAFTFNLKFFLIKCLCWIYFVSVAKAKQSIAKVNAWHGKWPLLTRKPTTEPKRQRISEVRFLGFKLKGAFKLICISHRPSRLGETNGRWWAAPMMLMAFDSAFSFSSVGHVSVSFIFQRILRRTEFSRHFLLKTSTLLTLQRRFCSCFCFSSLRGFTVSYS